ncbi:uncharacterized protein LOC135466285 [Liolophura sinensis]|uniref:uncharacterized protein LOC135466285 n=1 Tax=Liolophura sinensis TaxID=3198878 RepID=UPI003158AF4E
MKLEIPICRLTTLVLTITSLAQAMIPLPPFKKLKENYPGYRHHGGYYSNKKFLRLIKVKSEDLLHDTSALRLSYAFNKVGGEHSLGKQLIRLSKYGQDSVQGKQGMQFIFHPIAYGPYMADKYGYPSVSKVHETDPLDTMKSFYGKQGILRVLTYTKRGNIPNGHVALWDCTHFHQTKDWITKHTLISVEFWESPDSNCAHAMAQPQDSSKTIPTTTPPTIQWKEHSEITNERNLAKKLHMSAYMKKLYRTYYKHKSTRQLHRHGHLKRHKQSTMTT